MHSYILTYLPSHKCTQATHSLFHSLFIIELISFNLRSIVHRIVRFFSSPFFMRNCPYFWYQFSPFRMHTTFYPFTWFSSFILSLPVAVCLCVWLIMHAYFQREPINLTYFIMQMCVDGLGTLRERKKKWKGVWHRTCHWPFSIGIFYSSSYRLPSMPNFSSISLSFAFYLFHLFVLTLPMVIFFGQCIIFGWNVNETKITWFNRNFIRNYFVCVYKNWERKRMSSCGCSM